MLETSELNRIYGAEKTLTILLIRVFFKTESTIEVNQFITNNYIQWDFFYSFIKKHSIRPVIYNVSIQNKIKIDALILTKLKEDVFQITIRGFQQLKKTFEIHKILKCKNIDTIPYKGANFNLRYYPSIGFRESVDIDLLVDVKDVSQIKLMLENLGYICYTDVPKSYLSYIFVYAKDLCFYSKMDDLGFQFSIEIHWKLLEPSNGNFASYDYLKKNISKRKFGMYVVPELNETSNFLAYYSHHCIQDPLFKLKYLIDLGLMLQNTNRNINWVEVKKVLKEFMQENKFSACINTIEDVIGIKFDNFQIQKINHKVLLDSVLAYPITQHYGKQYFSLLLNFQVNFFEKLKTLLRFVFYSLFPTTGDINTFKLPRRAFPLLLLLRPFRIIWKYIFK